MKDLKKFVAALIVMVSFSSAVFADAPANNNIPAVVAASFNKKYPGAQVKTWHTKNSVFTAKAVINNHKYFVAFDKNGNWLNTTSNIPWQWNLPKNINTAYNKTQYNNWNVYYAKKVEKPSGEYYQIMVDDTNLHIGQNNRPLYNTDKLLEFKADGTLAMIKDITENPVP
jgi:hypothetical protein